MSCYTHRFPDSPAIEVYHMYSVTVRYVALCLMPYLGGAQCYFHGQHSLTVFCIMGVTAKRGLTKTHASNK